MNRTKSIFVFQILWIVLSAVQTTFAQTPSRQKPNIIYILTDQWRASATGYSSAIPYSDDSLSQQTPRKVQ